MVLEMNLAEQTAPEAIVLLLLVVQIFTDLVVKLRTQKLQKSHLLKNQILKIHQLIQAFVIGFADLAAGNLD
jgi:hypothetical protein